MPNSTGKGGFKRGESGNKRGRPVDSSPAAAWRAAIGKDVGKVISVVTQLALSGDAACCRLILERTVPAFRPADSGVVLPMPSNGTLTERALAMVDAMSAGLVSPAAAAATINALAAMVKVTEIDDLERRLRSLEEDQGKEPSRG